MVTTLAEKVTAEQKTAPDLEEMGLDERVGGPLNSPLYPTVAQVRTITSVSLNHPIPPDVGQAFVEQTPEYLRDSAQTTVADWNRFIETTDKTPPTWSKTPVVQNLMTYALAPKYGPVSANDVGYAAATLRDLCKRQHLDEALTIELSRLANQ